MNIQEMNEKNNNLFNEMFPANPANDDIYERIMGIVAKPRYIRYTIQNLKKRSTVRLAKMFVNIFGFEISCRSTMIEMLFDALNDAWNEFTKNFWFWNDAKGIWSIDGCTTYPNPKGRKPKFSKAEAIEILLYAEETGEKLVNLAKRFGTNIATISQILNGIYSQMIGDIEDGITA